MRIVVLCNDRLALPALQLLVQNRLVLSVGLPNRHSEPAEVIRGLCRQAAVPHQKFTKQNLEVELEAWLLQHQPDVVLVKTFPWLIPSRLLKIPKHGFINFHYAPLPEFRGPSPLFWMIRNRVAEIGVTAHRMDDSFDTGDVLLQKRVPLSPDLTFGMCTAQLAFMGAEMTGQILQALHQAAVIPVKQENTTAQWYARPSANDLRIDWNTMDAAMINALVKACNPWAKGAPVSWNNWTFGITETSVTKNISGDYSPGTIITLDEKQGVIIACFNKTAIHAEVIYTEEGFFPANRLAIFGLKAGMRLS
jgi:methionyl-tRNA formyltransferase